ncbi:hypothetical protein PDESU_01142 [Pontiella desulfatans]|uniref:RNA polymerase sigma-70 region 2 domain-containing protein n=1 Tax=Pontiella desulfatans TaxID=2750659 RepID=A0A6C2TYB5_PONDE|nr:sigma-70 family RNA polymerase sigma factor [Pontiella desulfatans]VGO12589.1 hypothetical protein PDESU_01142 [Pontiella desulfatans]
MADTYLTRQTLLGRVLKENAEEAWEEFASIYRPFVLILLRRLDIRWEEQEDIAQEVMVKILKDIQSYNGKSKFRTWLMTLVRNTAYSHLTKNSRLKTREEKYATDPTGPIPEQHDFEEMYQKQWEAYICTVAFKRIQPKFTGKAVEVFQMTMDGQDADKICHKLKLTKETVYCLRTRVKNALIDEVARLCQQMEL